jgi:hypothetical protein
MARLFRYDGPDINTNGRRNMTIRSAATAAALVSALMFSVAGVAGAQTHRSHLGPHVTYNFDIEEVAIGAQFSTPIGGPFEFYPSFDYFLVDVGSLWALNLDLKLRVSGSGLDWLYLGGGLNVNRRSVGDESANDTNLGVFAGFETLAGRIHPYGELRLIAGEGTAVQGTFGLNFTLGR